ncbi:hypothetical protein LXA43DRAFT_1101292 [Ganoderma leucocontextum]|nr:hypothetical protein LXA43DRAFT_1101292 [Ganoderma leucocontextum]
MAPPQSYYDTAYRHHSSSMKFLKAAATIINEARNITLNIDQPEDLLLSQAYMAIKGHSELALRLLKHHHSIVTTPISAGIPSSGASYGEAVTSQTREQIDDPLCGAIDELKKILQGKQLDGFLHEKILKVMARVVAGESNVAGCQDTVYCTEMALRTVCELLEDPDRGLATRLTSIYETALAGELLARARIIRQNLPNGNLPRRTHASPPSIYDSPPPAYGSLSPTYSYPPPPQDLNRESRSGEQFSKNPTLLPDLPLHSSDGTSISGFGLDMGEPVEDVERASDAKPEAEGDHVSGADDLSKPETWLRILTLAAEGLSLHGGQCMENAPLPDHSRCQDLEPPHPQLRVPAPPSEPSARYVSPSLSRLNLARAASRISHASEAARTTRLPRDTTEGSIGRTGEVHTPDGNVREIWEPSEETRREEYLVLHKG